MTRDHHHLLPAMRPIQFLQPNGTAAVPVADMPKHSDLQRAYGALVAARRLNDQAYALVRQGRLAVYPSSHGQEACQIAAAHVLGSDDWLFPTYRDTVAMMTRGVPPLETMTLLKGDWHSGFDPYEYRVSPQATPLATQLLHAVGFAHAATLRGEHTVALALCGDGATSEGDFHEALNFAAVFNAPVVFLVQNNGYAISVPLSQQTKAPTLAHKGIGYGVPGQQVDGNDMAAMLSVLGDAVEAARQGKGPQLIEAHTYRMQSHTNADDASRYRSDAEVAEWVARDPLTRLEKYLSDHDLLDAEMRAEFTAEAERMAQAMREGLNTDATPDPNDLFDYVYAKPTVQLEAQRADLLDALGREAAMSQSAAVEVSA